MEANGILTQNEMALAAADSVNRSIVAFCKFISANDAGQTGGHQSGFYIPHNSYELLFDTPCKKGELKDRNVKIKWQGDFETDSRFIYYGQKTRNEYRITRFGKGFPFLKDEYVGDLFVLCKIEEDYYEGFVISGDEQTESFLSTFGLSATETNKLIPIKKKIKSPEEVLDEVLHEFLKTINDKFPPTTDISEYARTANLKITSRERFDKSINPDKSLIEWIDIEYRLFKILESHIYRDKIRTSFESLDALVEFSNIILNRRKSRAGKSLEHHLAAIFRIFELPFSSQAKTELHKRPDFIFPGEEEYHRNSFNPDKLVFLAAKTTCKDRWRQILNEADKIPTKYLFTLQQGISQNQLLEMNKHNVFLVVPESYIYYFPKTHRKSILTLSQFLVLIKEKQK